MTGPRSTRGDLVVMSPTRNAISALIQKYDRSPYTHVGLDVGDGSVVNCRTEGELIKAGENGGVRLDWFSEITDRRCYRVPVDQDQPTKDAAVDTALDWVEEDGLGTTSGFSFPKMFQCAVAVDASRPEAAFTDDARADMLDAAFAAAEEWAYDGSRASFFCAEMVVEAYGWQVPRALLAPPVSMPESLVRAGLVDVEALAEEIRGIRAAGRRTWTMAAVVGAVLRHDRDFFASAFRSVKDWLSDHPEDGGVRGAADSDVLPAALVTPRMLLGCSWVGEVDPTPVVD